MSASPVEVVWVTRGGIKVATNGRSSPPPPPPKWETLHDLIACPTCFARVDETCRTKSGNVTKPHGSRLVSRRCSCGNAVAPQCSYCSFCAREKLQQSKNEHGRLRRQAARARHA